MGDGAGRSVLEDVDAPGRADPIDQLEASWHGDADAAPPQGAVGGARRRSPLQFWRSPDDQPAWARPLLLLIAALAALSYAWGMGNDTLETFYAASARSMSQSWHNFVFGSFDPWGTVSVDKLPGAFWIQALSARAFGVHTWSLVLPQVVEGTLTILVLFRAVRRVCGAGAGLVAAGALAATPVTILLNRGNISDSLLILLLVLAADATTKAITTGRVQPLLLAGVWVGLAFQAKMLQAWVVLPALFVAYLVAAPNPDLVRRVSHVALCGVVAIVVSLSWMVAISLVPTHDRPYVDASCNDSVFSQVFRYNGTDRLHGTTLDEPGCSPAVSAASATPGGSSQTVVVPRGPGRFLDGAFGRDVDWFLVPAAVAFAGILVVRRRQPRTDTLRAGALLWGAWLFFTWCFFASSHFLNSYYLAALAPAIAALCGMGAALAWRRRAQRGVRIVLLGTVAAGTLYALVLLPANAGVRPWVLATTLLVALAAIALVARSLLRAAPSWVVDAGVVLSAVALGVGSAWAAGTAVTSGLGPFDSPYQPASSQSPDAVAASHLAANANARVWSAAAHVPAGVSVLTEETSALASAGILATGREFLPVGGFSGRVPSTPLSTFVADVRAGKVADVSVSVAPPSRNPDMEWVTTHCAPVTGTSGIVRSEGQTMRLYRCSPSDVTNSTATAGSGLGARP